MELVYQPSARKCDHRSILFIEVDQTLVALLFQTLNLVHFLDELLVVQCCSNLENERWRLRTLQTSKTNGFPKVLGMEILVRYEFHVWVLKFSDLMVSMKIMHKGKLQVYICIYIVYMYVHVIYISYTYHIPLIYISYTYRIHVYHIIVMISSVISHTHTSISILSM